MSQKKKKSSNFPKLARIFARATPGYLDLRDAADYLNISPSMLERWLASERESAQ